LIARNWVFAILGNVLPSVAYWETMASVGNAGGIEFTSNFLPFLIRGINLCGINSNTCQKDRRLETWSRLAKNLPLDKLGSMTNEAPLAQMIRTGRQDSPGPGAQPHGYRR